MTHTQMEEAINNCDRRLSAVEQILPTLATKQDLQEGLADLKRDLLVRIEAVDARVQILAEGGASDSLKLDNTVVWLATGMKRLDEHSGILTAMTTRLDEHSGILSAVTTRLDEHSGILSAVTTQLDEHSGILSAVTTQLDEHSGILTAIATRLDSLTERLERKGVI